MGRPRGAKIKWFRWAIKIYGCMEKDKKDNFIIIYLGFDFRLTFRSRIASIFFWPISPEELFGMYLKNEIN